MPISNPVIPRLFANGPLTDPRSLISSALFHALVLTLASLTVAKFALPLAESPPKDLLVTFDPVDNRADIRTSPGAGGGGKGDIGGLSDLPFIPPSNGSSAIAVTHGPVADTLLAEILPNPRPKPGELLQTELVGPQTTGQGLIPGSGLGGGGGAGGGSGGGIGRTIGPGTQFFGARAHAHSFAYVIDCSGSMATRNSLEVAKREMLASIGQLPPDAQFVVIFYNLQARMLSDTDGRKGLMAATAPNKARVQAQLSTIAPDGGTDHMAALREALRLKPEVIFFLTDADLMTNSDVNEVLLEVGPTQIQAVEFGRGTELGQRTPLGRLATNTGGSYLYIDVSQFPRSKGGF
jgi:hypothetical protein